MAALLGGFEVGRKVQAVASTCDTRSGTRPTLSRLCNFRPALTGRETRFADGVHAASADRPRAATSKPASSAGHPEGTASSSAASGSGRLDVPLRQNERAIYPRAVRSVQSSNTSWPS